MNYARAIRLARVTRGLSQRRLAALAQFSPSYLCLIEKGHRVPALETLESIARATEFPLFLLALLGSDAGDLHGVNVEQVKRFGNQLLMNAMLHNTPLGEGGVA